MTGINLKTDGIELIGLDGDIVFIPVDQLAETAPHIASWLPVFVIIQEMIVRGATASLELTCGDCGKRKPDVKKTLCPEVNLCDDCYHERYMDIYALEINDEKI